MASKSTKSNKRPPERGDTRLVRPCKGTLAFRHDLGFGLNLDLATKLLVGAGYECKVMVQGLALLYKDDHEVSLHSFGKVLIANVDAERAETVAKRIVPLLREAKA